MGSVGCGVSDDQFYCPLGYEEPFKLGEPFQFGVTVKADGPGCGLCDTGDGSAALTGVTVTFYEVNGVTPVSVFEVDPPVATAESGTSLMIAIGLLALFTRRLFLHPDPLKGPARWLRRFDTSTFVPKYHPVTKHTRCDSAWRLTRYSRNSSRVFPKQR